MTKTVKLPDVSALLDYARSADKRYRQIIEALPAIEAFAQKQSLVAELDKALQSLKAELAELNEQKEAGKDVLLQIEKDMRSVVGKADKDAKSSLQAAAQQAENIVKAAVEKANQIVKAAEQSAQEAKQKVTLKLEELTEIARKTELKDKELADKQAMIDALIRKVSQ